MAKKTMRAITTIVSITMRMTGGHDKSSTEQLVYPLHYQQFMFFHSKDP